MLPGRPHYYANPAFCQQSEFYAGTRQPPIGAHTQLPADEDNADADGAKKRQQRYAMIPVDDDEIVQYNEKRQIRIVKMDETFEEHEDEEEEEVEVAPGRVHRYAVIPSEEQQQQQQQQQTKPVHQVRRCESTRSTWSNRSVVVTAAASPPPLPPPLPFRGETRPYATSPPTTPRRFDTIIEPRALATSPPPTPRRCDQLNESSRSYIMQASSPPPTPQRCENPNASSAQRRGNSTATQKLHELLTTPKKTPRTQRHTSSVQPRAQQKLNYTLSTRQQDSKRHTAIIAPICSSPVQSVYSETTFSNQTASWGSLSFYKPKMQATLAAAAIMMALCGGLASGLCFYMVSVMGRQYFLDFGIVSGFTCLLLGLLGYRARNCYWLPNRNYISGYIVLSVFSLLTCAGLLMLLFKQPKPGSPLADVTSGAVCGISALSLFLASVGVVSSYCCKYPPPDNRVQHCARGFSI